MAFPKKAAKAAKAKFEGSKADKAMDKKMGVKEGSAADKKMDAAGAKKVNAGKVMSASTAAKKARAGVDMGKPNVPGKTGFAAVAAKAGGGAKGQKVAGAVFQKMRKKGQL